jgi:DNA helicase-2/ATP-dependent DNA helicase PcrA
MAVSESTSHPRPFAPDERQREAIEHVHGPMLVVAGAGTGKTTVLTKRIARLVREGHARPNQILAVTYTKNAAQEMSERVRRELHGMEVAGLQVRTFHDYCNELLARNGKQFGVLDDKDLWVYLRRRIRELRLNYFVRAADVAKFLTDLLDFMRRCQDELVGPEKYAEYVRRLERGELPIPRVSKRKDADALREEEVLGRCREIAQVFATVERMLRAENLGSFGHMITGAHELLQDAMRLSEERECARFILVDEFQDANFAQVKILQMLAGEERNVFAVGDPDQAIYRFRGASSAAFGLFQRHFPNARTVTLEKNRRSTTPILRTAFALISKNPEVLAGEGGVLLPSRRSPLISARDEQLAGEGREVQNAPAEAVLSASNETECSDVVTAIALKKREARCKWKDFAILYRQHSHRDLVAVELAQRGIPFSIENMDVIDMPEVRDLLACLGAVVSVNDGASLFRVAALTQFAIDPKKLRAGMQALPKESSGGGVALVLAQIEGGAAALETLQRALDESLRTEAKARAALEIVIRSFGFNRASRPVMAVVDFVTAWEQKAITKTRELSELLEYLEYFREANGAIPLSSSDDDAVHLMTAHSAKGLEWDHVFILRANSNSFPSSYKEALVEFPSDLRDPDSVAQAEGKELHDEEERRLFYVAMTRARDTLAIYARPGKGKEAAPAGFLRDLVKDRSLSRWFRTRLGRPFQTDLFAEAAPAVALSSRTSEWLKLPPSSDLSARLSATAVETYERCPLQFKFEREWKIPRDVPAAIQYGAAIHRVLCTYYDCRRSKREMADDALIELFRADLGRAGIQDRYQHELYEEQGIAQLRDFLATNRTTPGPEVLNTEQWFEVRIGGVTVSGRIDRMDRGGDGRVIITDYKTGKPRSQKDADESLQLSVYALAAREKWGYDAGSLVLYNLEENSPVITRRSEPQLEDAQLKVEEVAENIAAGIFKAKPGFHCKFCPYNNLCPETEKHLYAPASGSTQRRRDTKSSLKS